MAYRNRTRRGKRTGIGGLEQKTKAIFLLIAAGLLLAILGYYNFTASAENSRIDKETYCLKEAPEEITVVLIDHTDRISAVQRASLEQRLWDIAREIPKNSEIRVFAVDKVTDKVLAPEISLCNPGSENDVNELTGNKTLAHMHYEERFREPLRQILDRIFNSDTASQSPIMEAIQSVTVTSFIGTKNQNARKKLILVSDLLEHTDSFSHYRGIEDFEAYAKTSHWRTVKSDLDNVDVEIFFLRRDGADRLQTTDLRSFWIQFFENQGAVVSRFIPIEG